MGRSARDSNRNCRTKWGSLIYNCILSWVPHHREKTERKRNSSLEDASLYISPLFAGGGGAVILCNKTVISMRSNVKQDWHISDTEMLSEKSSLFILLRQVDSIRCEQNSHITRTIKSNERELPSWARLFSNSNQKAIKVKWLSLNPKYREIYSLLRGNTSTHH